jgi:hypothetical protein
LLVFGSCLFLCLLLVLLPFAFSCPSSSPVFFFFSFLSFSLLVNQRKNKSIFQKFIDDMNSFIVSIIPSYSRCLSKRNTSQKNYIRYIHPESKNISPPPLTSSVGDSCEKIDTDGDQNVSLHHTSSHQSHNVLDVSSNIEMITSLSTTTDENLVVPYTSAAYQSVLKMNTLDNGDFLE